MPLDLHEEGLPENPDLKVAQWLFLLNIDEAGVNKDDIWRQLQAVIQKDC